jgi:hypothetical protein
MKKRKKDKGEPRRKKGGFLAWFKGLKWWGKVLLVFGVVLIVGFVTWLIIRVTTMETAFWSEISFALPEGEEIGLAEGVNEKYAVAIDGQVVVPNDEVRPTASTAKMILGLAVMREKPFELGGKGETL